MRATLHPYQEYCVAHIKAHPFCGLFLDMGLGKTLITLTALCDLLLTGEIAGRVLVIAPLAVARHVWPAEIAKWDHTAHLTYSIAVGTPERRTAAVNAKTDLCVINRENVPWLVHTFDRKPWPFDTIVLDELSSFKSNQSQRFKALRAVRPHVKRVIGLTGTPAPNSLIDLWPQLFLLDQGERLEKFIGKYRQKYFYPVQQNGHIVYRWGLRDGAEDEIHRRISDICVSMRAKDHLALPPRTDNILIAELSPEARKTYKRLERDSLAEVDSSTLTAANAAVLAGKLLQFANGAVYNTNKGEWSEIHNEKLSVLKNAVEEAQGQPIIVYYQYKHDLARIKKAFPEAEELNAKNDSVARWNAKEIPVMLAHPQSAGHGLNLQAGGHIAIWFGLTWSLEQYAQANARLDRQGQTEPVIIHHIVAAGTIDERVMQVLSGKARLMDALLEAVKAYA